MGKVMDAEACHAKPAPPMQKENERSATPGTVALVDEQQAGRIYDGSILRFALLGGVLGAIALAWLAYAFADGIWTIAGVGQFAAAGVAPATFAGAGVGVALGALAGAIVALYRLPAR